MKIIDVPEGIDYDYIIKCENCDKDVLKIDYESCCGGNHEVLDEHAVVYCEDCDPFNLKKVMGMKQEIDLSSMFNSKVYPITDTWKRKLCD